MMLPATILVKTVIRRNDGRNVLRLTSTKSLIITRRTKHAPILSATSIILQLASTIQKRKRTILGTLHQKVPSPEFSWVGTAQKKMVSNVAEGKRICAGIRN